MPARAYVLITLETSFPQYVVEHLKEVKGAVAVHEVIGPYDIVVELEADTYEDMTATLRQQIRPIQGIRTTVTCPWM